MQQFKIHNIPLLTFTHFPDKKVTHLSSTISGGVSIGNYTSFNLGEYSGDKPMNVSENRQRLAKALHIGIDKIIVPHQTHRDNILSIDKNFLSLSREKKKLQLENIDALITNQTDIFIGVTTADCVPVLIYDPVKNIIATIHAGWKGTAVRITAKTVTKMVSEYKSNPYDLIVGIGPSISPERFEVGDEVGDTFATKGFSLSDISFRNKQTGKLHINLWKANYIQLLEMSVLPNNIEIAGLCTQSNPNLFFSARRQSIHSGRMLTGGMLR